MSRHQARSRKVQFTTLVKEGHNSSPRALDELGIDPAPLATLHAALERHSSDPSSLHPTAAQDIGTRELPLLHGIYIAPSETDGLPAPGTDDLTSKNRAIRLVKAHRRGKYGWPLKVTVKKVLGEVRQPLDIEKQPSTSGTTKPENDTTMLGGPGVLSSLLALSDHQRESYASTPGVQSSDEEWSQASLSNKNRNGSSLDSLSRYFGTIQRGGRHQSDTQDHTEKTASAGPTTLPRTPLLPRLPLPPAIRKVLPNQPPFASSNAGGVVGSLITTTGNIVGAAVPAAGSVGPDVKRSGFHLSRYSIEVPPKTTPSSNPPSRPNSILNFWEEEYQQHGQGSTTPALASSTGGTSTPTTSAIISSNSWHTHDTLPLNSDIGVSDAPTTGRSSRIGLKRTRWTQPLIELPSYAHRGFHLLTGKSPAPSVPGTPSECGDPSTPDSFKEYSHKGARTDNPRKGKLEWNERRRQRKTEKEWCRKQEVFITRHIAEILSRQEFILKLTRALIMFGAPAHRLEAQIQATARVLDVQLSCFYLPNVMTISFGDSATHTSETKFIKQVSSLDMGRLQDSHQLYWDVIHDQIGVIEASRALDNLMKRHSYSKGWMTVLSGGFCSAFITPVAFRGSFVDALASFPLGCLLVFVQNVVATNELYGNVFEIAIATIISLLAAFLGSTTHLCYTAIASGSVVLILPGYIVLCGSLEIASRNITSGAVRLGYSIIYSLFLGFGLSIGSEIYRQATDKGIVGQSDYLCSNSHNQSGPWWQKTPSSYWAFLCVPGYSLFLSLKNQQPIKRKELVIMTLISCCGWTTNYFSTLRFANRSDVTSALGSFVVGVLGNLYGRFFSGNAFVVMLTGILFQVPSGLSNGGLLAFAEESSEGATTSYSTGFSVAEQLVSVALGLTVGLFCSAALVHPFGGGRKRGSGLFSL